MAKLTDLSTELLLSIVAHLATDKTSDVRALRRLCESSRTLAAVAQPALYACVKLSMPTRRSLNPLELFMRTCMECPELAKETRQLSLFHSRPIPNEGFGLARDAIAVRVSRLIADQDEEIVPESLALHLLARLPNLEHLRLEVESSPPRGLLKGMHVIRKSDDSFLARLKTLHLHKQFENSPISMEDYIPLMRYPSFERFSTESDLPEIVDVYPATNMLTHSAAELFWWLGPLPTMRRLLDACPRLTTFKLVIPDGGRYGGKVSEDVASQPLVGPRELVVALRETHKQKLETLHLDFRHYYDLSEEDFLVDMEQTGDEPENYVYPSFREFESLSHMTIEYEKLVKLEHLPASLKRLELQNCHTEDLSRSYLHDLVRLKEMRCPLIEQVRVTGTEYSAEGIERIREHAEALEIPVHASADGRHLGFRSVGYGLEILIRAE